MYAASWQRERRDWSWLDGGDESGLFRSTDGGDSWERLDNGLPTEDVGRVGVSVCTSRPDRVYSVLAGRSGGVFRSEDRGASWERVNAEVRTSQYYGQVRCDPGDPDRVYVLETGFWVSHDGGRTFTNEMQGKPVHVDHHALWIDPHDSDHLLLGNDGGVYLSRDRGAHWRFVDNLPITQFYEIGADLREPYYTVYGGTQDNNTFGAPSGTRNRAGVVNDDWFMTVGGDGFYARPDPGEPRIVYTEWQNGNLVRFDALTGERKSIKPADPSQCDEDPETDAPDCYRWNWSAPVEISVHDPATLYFGSQVLFRSRDRGDAWEVLSPDLTRALRYESPMNDFGTLRVIEESPRDPDVLVLGTDDGLVQITEDGGATWRRSEALPGVPEMALVRRVVLSAHDRDTLYVASSVHEYNDFTPYLSRSRDLGRSWQRLDGGMAPHSPIRAFAESPGTPGVLFVGTEHDLLVSLDDGAGWQSLRNNLPTVAIHDILVHPRQHDLIVGTHGRGIWILDDVRLLDGVAAGAAEPGLAVFEVRPALQMHRFDRGRRSRGSSFFAAANPPDGAIVDLAVPTPSVGAAGDDDALPAIELAVRDAAGQTVRHLGPAPQAGLQRLLWDLRHDPAWESPSDQGRTVPGPWVLPGEYLIELRVGSTSATQRVMVRADPAVRISPPDRTLWHATQLELAGLIGTLRDAGLAATWARDAVVAAAEALGDKPGAPEALGQRVGAAETEAREVADEIAALGRRVEGTYRAMRGVASRPTDVQLQAADQVGEELAELVRRINTLVIDEIPELGRRLDAAGVAWSPGRPVRMPGSGQP